MDGEATESSAPAESTVSTVSTITTEATSTDNTENTSEPHNKPAGFEAVEFTKEQQERVNRIYGNMKRYENDAREMRNLNAQLATEITNLTAGQQQIVSHLQVNNFQDAENSLRSDRDSAWKRGDMDAYNTANDKLGEIRTKKALTEIQPKQTAQQPPQPRGLDAGRLVNRALEKSDLSSAEANIAKAWMSETDDTGNLKRPWTQENDQRNYAAALEGQAVFNSPQWVDKPIGEKLKEIDRRMGIKQQNNSGGQNVLSAGNLTRGTRTNNITLTPDIERVAIRTKFGGPSAKTDQDHVEAWKKAVAKSHKGASR